jgi:uncharacterized protein (PEP-CTERM system associated)
MISRSTGADMALLAAGLWTAGPVFAADIVFAPSIGLEEKFTDNALATSSNRRADLITTITPELKLTGTGSGLSFGLDYQPGYDAYASQTQLNGWRHEGFAQGNAELVKNWLFLDVRGSASEENANPVGQAVSTDRTAPTNRIQVASYSVSPSLRHAFADQLLGELSYKHDQISYSNASQAQTGQTSATTTNATDSTGDGGRFDLRTGDAHWLTQGGYTADADRVARDGMVFTHLAHTGRIEQAVVPGIALLGHVGHDRVNDPDIDGQRYGGAFYGGGVHLVPGQESDLRAEVGHRYGGLEITALGKLKLGAFTKLNLSQQTNLQTEQQAFAESLDSAVRDAEGRFIDPFSDRQARPNSSPFTRSTAVFKQRRSDVALVYGDERDQLSLGGGQVTRESVSRSTPGTTSARVVSASLDHRLREDLSTALLVGYEDIYYGTAATDTGRSVRAVWGLTYLVNPMTTVRAGYRYVGTQPDQGVSSHENMVSLGARMTF